MDKRLIDLICRISGVRSDEVTSEARIYNDLGIYGDDAIELLVAYGKEFNVDISNFMAADYFEGEGLDAIGLVVGLFSGKKKQYKTLTVSHLENGIVAGRLDEEIINQTKLTP
jgi:acyl carrier protein